MHPNFLKSRICVESIIRVLSRHHGFWPFEDVWDEVRKLPKFKARPSKRATVKLNLTALCAGPSARVEKHAVVTRIDREVFNGAKFVYRLKRD